MHLPENDFRALIKNGILLSIDLIIKNDREEVLLGQRKNDPAKGYWFVPGGRIFKNESFREALHRICRAEVGELQPAAPYRFIGTFNHIYDDNFFGDPAYNTHYIAMGIELRLSDFQQKNQMENQHERVKFLSVADLLKDGSVHAYTQYYFVKDAPNRFL